MEVTTSLNTINSKHSRKRIIQMNLHLCPWLKVFPQLSLHCSDTHVSVKLNARKICIFALLFKSTGPQRNLKWWFHSVYINILNLTYYQYALHSVSTYR
jgi:hypothetical protein